MTSRRQEIDWVQRARAHISALDSKSVGTDCGSSIVSSLRTAKSEFRAGRRPVSARVGDYVDDVVPSVSDENGGTLWSVKEVKRMVHKLGSRDISDEERSAVMETLLSLKFTPNLGSALARPREDGKDIYSALELAAKQAVAQSTFFHQTLTFVTRCLKSANQEDSSWGRVALDRVGFIGILKSLIRKATGFNHDTGPVGDSDNFEVSNDGIDLDCLVTVAHKFSENEDTLLATVTESAFDNNKTVQKCLKAPTALSSRVLPRATFSIPSGAFTEQFDQDFDRVSLVNDPQSASSGGAIGPKSGHPDIFYLHCIYPSGHALISPGLKRNGYIEALHDMGRSITECQRTQTSLNSNMGHPKGPAESVVWFARFCDLKFRDQTLSSSHLCIPPKYLLVIETVRVCKITSNFLVNSSEENSTDEDVFEDAHEETPGVNDWIDVYLVDLGFCALVKPAGLFQLHQDDGAATELMNTQPLLKFVRIICKRNCPETADLVAGLLLQLSKSLEPHLTLTFWGGSDDLREWKKLLETCANKENSTNVSLLAVRALSRLAKVSHNRPGLTGPRHNTEFWTQLCISVAKVLFRPGLEPATVEDGVLFLFYAMDFMPPERLKKTFQEGNIALLVSKLRREETNDGNQIGTVLDRISHFQTDDGLWHNTAVRQQNQQQRPRLSEFQRFQRDLRQRAPITRDENQQQRPKFSEFQSFKRDLTQQAPITQQQRPRFSEFESFKRDLRQQAPITRKRDESLERLCQERPMEAARMFNIESINQQLTPQTPRSDQPQGSDPASPSYKSVGSEVVPNEQPSPPFKSALDHNKANGDQFQYDLNRNLVAIDKAMSNLKPLKRISKGSLARVPIRNEQLAKSLNGPGNQGRKGFYLSKTDLNPTIDFKITTRSPEVRIKDEMGAGEKGGCDRTYNYETIITIQKELQPQFVFFEKAPPQMDFGRHLCALLNNQGKRGSMVVGVTPTGLVRGILMDRKDKDIFRQNIDSALRRFDPVNPSDNGLVLPPTFKAVCNHPSELRPAHHDWDTKDKNPVIIEIEVVELPRKAVFSYAGETFVRTKSGQTKLVHEEEVRRNM